MLNEAQVIKTAKSAIMQGADGGVATLAWAQRAEAVKSSVKYTMVVALRIRIERADLHSSNHALTTEAIPRGLLETSELLQRHVRIAHGRAIRPGLAWVPRRKEGLGIKPGRGRWGIDFRRTHAPASANEKSCMLASML